jgi:tetratricopeptide (TPR) repeat protein
MNEFCFPIDAIKARYFIEDKKYDEALVLLNRSAGVNPYIAYNEYLKGHIFLATNRPDSAFYYAKIAFNKRPRSKAIYFLLNAACLNLKDSITIEKTFREMILRRNEPWAWEEYITSLFILKADKQKLMAITDSALKLFTMRLTQRLNQIKADLQNMLSDTNRIQKADIQKYQQLITEATESYNKKNYTMAIRDFKKAAEMNPGDYTNYENTGLSYYFLFDFKSAMPWFDKVIQMKSSTDGKSEFFKALCLIYLNKRAEACPWLKIANAKNYKDAKSYLASNCGGG